MQHPEPADVSRPGHDLVVSVVMPFKDAASFLERAARSVLAQTWPAVELVLVDDGGTDGGVDIADRLRGEHPDSVRVVCHPGRVNRGTGPSRRLGIEATSGEFIGALDADDIWEPRHLEDQVDLLLRSPEADMAVCRAWTWRSWADPTAADVPSALPFAPGVVVPGTSLLGAVLRNGTYATPTCSLLARRSLFGPWIQDVEPFSGMYEDQVLNSGLQLRGTAVISGSTSAWYRQHPESFSAGKLHPDPSLRYDHGRAAFLEWLGRQPQVVHDSNLAELVRAEREAVRRRLDDRAGAATVRPGRATPATTVPTALRRLGRPLLRALPVRNSAALAGAAPERLRLLLFRHGSDLRGRVLVLGDAPPSWPGVAPADVSVRPLPERNGSHGPYHPLAGLASGGYDCVLVLDEGASGVWWPEDLRQLRRILAPGGVLLFVLGRLLPTVERAVRDTFDSDLVRRDPQHEPGPPGRPLTAVRAVVPR